jgi:hypothetical protein
VSLALVPTPGIGNEPGYGLVVPGDDDLFAALHPIQQRSQRVLGLEGAI